MKIAELFVDLGIQGSEKAVTALAGIKQALTDVATTVGVVTTALAGAIYAFEKLSSESNQTGFGLSQFEKATGLSADTLQRWQQLGINSGVTADEVTKSVRNLQNIMFQMVAGGKAPEGIAFLQQELAKLGKPIDTTRFRDVYYMMGKLREFARESHLPPDFKKHVLDSFGLGDDFQQALKTSTFDLAKADPRRMYSENQLQTLTDLHNRWMKLIDEIQHSIGKLNVRFGPGLVSDIEKLAHALLDLASALGELNEQIGVLKFFKNVVSDFAFFGHGIAKTIRKGIEEHNDPKGGIWKQTWDKIKEPFNEPFAGPGTPSMSRFFGSGMAALQSLNGMPQAGIPYMTTNNFEVHIDGAQDPHAVVQEFNRQTSKMINDAARQIPSFNTGSGS